MRTERGEEGDDGWKLKKRLNWKEMEESPYLIKLFSLQAPGPTEGEPGVVSPLVHGCLNKVYASNKRFCLLMLLLFGIWKFEKDNA